MNLELNVRLVSINNYYILQFIIGSEHTCHCSHHLQNRHRIPRHQGIQYRERSDQRLRLAQSILYKTTNPGFPLISGCVVILYVRVSCRLLIWCYNFIYFTGNFDDSCPCAVEMGITSIIIEQKRCIQRIRDALYNLHSYRSQLDYYHSRFLRPGRRIIFLTVFQRAISYTPID